MSKLYGGQVVAVQADKKGEGRLYLDGHIGSRLFDSGITRMAVRAEVERLGTLDVLHVHFNSPGGLVHEGMAIYSYLATLEGVQVVSHVDGLAASAASVVAMAGDEIRIYEGAQIMVHNALIVAIGNKKIMRKVVQRLEAADRLLNRIYQARTGLDERTVARLMDDETFMDAPRALELGFADVRVPAKKKGAAKGGGAGGKEDAQAATYERESIEALYHDWAEALGAVEEDYWSDLDAVGEGAMVAAALTRSAGPQAPEPRPAREPQESKGGDTLPLTEEERKDMLAEARGQFEATLAPLLKALGVSTLADATARATVLVAENSEMEAEAARQAEKALEKSVDEALMQATRDCKIVPASVPAIRMMLDNWQEAAKTKGGQLQYIGADGRPATGTPLDALQAYLAGLPKLPGVRYGERGEQNNPAPGGHDKGGKDVIGGDIAEFADAHGYKIGVEDMVPGDEEAGTEGDGFYVGLDAEIREFTKAHNVDYATAFERVLEARTGAPLAVPTVAERGGSMYEEVTRNG